MRIIHMSAGAIWKAVLFMEHGSWDDPLYFVDPDDSDRPGFAIDSDVDVVVPNSFKPTLGVIYCGPWRRGRPS